jgi:hypothetical protein
MPTPRAFAVASASMASTDALAQGDHGIEIAAMSAERD